jgi:hypothetical protein
MTPRRSLANVIPALCIFILLAIAGLWFWNYRHSFQQVTITLPKGDGLTTRIYNASVVTEESSLDSLAKQQNVRELKTTETFKLKKGRYVVLATGSNYEPTQQTLSVGAQPASLSFNPDFSSGKLGSLLDQQLSVIHSTLRANIPATSGFTISRGRLYQTGDWYGTILKRKVSVLEAQRHYRDTYRVVLQKQGNFWRIVTKLELSLSKQTYPKIPVDVLRDVNAMTQ